MVEARGPRGGDLRAAVAFPLAVTAYFAVQLALRLGLGGALETDEAEMMVMTPGLRLGYGPQLPLYNWLQIGAFELFGRSLLALSLLKNALLWASYLLVFLGLRLWLPAGTAALGALSLFLVPDIAWEAQRATTHSNMLLATSALTLAAFLWALRSGSVASWGALGLAVGLGGLAKYNFWLVALGLLAGALSVAPMRARMLRRRALLAPAVAAAVLVAPYGWIMAHPDLAFSSLGKLQLNETGAPRAAPEGVAQMVRGLLGLLALPLLAVLGLWLSGRNEGAVPETGPGVAALLVRGALILGLVTLLGVWLADVGQITPRWLLPLAVLLVPGLFVRLHPRSSARAVGRLCLGLGLLAAAVIGGLAYDRYKPGARRDVDFASLPAALEQVAPLPATPIVTEFYTAGNLARLRPDWRIAPFLPFAAAEFGGGQVLFVLREDVPASLRGGLRQAGWPPDAEVGVIAEGALALPYGHSDGALPLRYVLATTPMPE